MYGKQLAELQGHTDCVLSAAFNPAGDKIATASYDGTARVWDSSFMNTVDEECYALLLALEKAKKDAPGKPIFLSALPSLRDHRDSARARQLCAGLDPRIRNNLKDFYNIRDLDLPQSLAKKPSALARRLIWLGAGALGAAVLTKICMHKYGSTKR